MEMWGILGILCVAAVIAYVGLTSLKGKAGAKERIVFCTILLSATALSIAVSLDLNVPNPLNGLIMLYKPISDYLNSVLHSRS